MATHQVAPLAQSYDKKEAEVKQKPGSHQGVKTIPAEPLHDISGKNDKEAETSLPSSEISSFPADIKDDAVLSTRPKTLHLKTDANLAQRPEKAEPVGHKSGKQPVIKKKDKTDEAAKAEIEKEMVSASPRVENSEVTTSNLTSESEDQKNGQKKYTWPTVAESLKRFQKSIAATPSSMDQLQRSRDQHRQNNNFSPRRELLQKAAKTKPAEKSEIDKTVISKPETNQESPDLASVEMDVTPGRETIERSPGKDSNFRSSGTALFMLQKILPPSPIITLSPEAMVSTVKPFELSSTQQQERQSQKQQQRQEQPRKEQQSQQQRNQEKEKEQQQHTDNDKEESSPSPTIETYRLTAVLISTTETAMFCPPRAISVPSTMVTETSTKDSVRTIPSISQTSGTSPSKDGPTAPQNQKSAQNDQQYRSSSEDKIPQPPSSIAVLPSSSSSSSLSSASSSTTPTAPITPTDIEIIGQEKTASHILRHALTQQLPPSPQISQRLNSEEFSDNNRTPTSPQFRQSDSLEPSSSSNMDKTDTIPPPETHSVPQEAVLMSSPRPGVRRVSPSGKLVVTVWDNSNEGDPGSRPGGRPCRRLWDMEDKPILAGISEIEEVQGGSQETGVKGGDLDYIDGEAKDTNRLDTEDGCRQRVRASRSPVRPGTRQRQAPRRSLSLPSGGLSYGDVKILYKDGHFVTVGASDRAPPQGKTAISSNRSSSSSLQSESGRQVEAGEEDSLLEGSAEGNPNVGAGAGGVRSPRRRASFKKSSFENLFNDESMRAEILALLERGITDPQRILQETSLGLDLNAFFSEGGRSRTGAPVFLSLPRRRHKGQRPVSVDEVQLWKYQSQSQQSLVSHVEMERRRQENGDDTSSGFGRRTESTSSLKRNDSFTEAMGSNLMLNDTDVAEEYHDTVSHHHQQLHFHRQHPSNEADKKDDAYEELQRTASVSSEDSKSSKSRTKGPGFIQRMLQKRKGSNAGETLDDPNQSLSNSTVSLNQHPRSTSPGAKNRERDSSVGRKMSLKGIFKRKNSSDLSAKRTSTSSEEPGSPPVATHLISDPIVSSSSPRSRIFHRSNGELDVLTEDLDGPYEIVDSFPSRSSRSRSGTDTSGASHGGLHRSMSYGESERPSNLDSLRERRSRSASGRTRTRGGRAVSMENMLSGSGDTSIGDYDLNRSDLHGSEGTLTPRSVSPTIAEETTMFSEGDRTLIASPIGSKERLSPPVYQQLDASPQSGRRRRSSRDEGGANLKGACAIPHQQLSGQDGSSGEITSSNSNDSGIQHDVNVGSSAESIQTSVKLRRSKSPSPGVERPKSDITVRWADLLEQVMVDHGGVRYRREAASLRKRPRPKSDIAPGSKVSSENSDSSVFSGIMGNIPAVGGSGAAAGLSHRLQSGDSLVELRKHKDPVAARLAKSRRMSTPQPITVRSEKPWSKTTTSSSSSSNNNNIRHSHHIHHLQPQLVALTHSLSMPDNLDKLSRKKNYISLIAPDALSMTSQPSGGDESSDESDYSSDCHPEKSRSARSSHVMLAPFIQMLEEENLTYAEALWDHVTMDPEELGFRAGDLIRVIDNVDKHWWFGVLDDREGWFPASFVRLRVNQEVMDGDLAYWLTGGEEEEELVTQQHVSRVMTSGMNFGVMDQHQARANVVSEIISAEREYVKHLRDVVEGYVKQAQKRPEMFPIEKVTVIFSNIEEIYAFATNLLEQLESCVNSEQPHLSQLGQCFLSHGKGFEMYSDYCNNHPAACEELRELYRNKKYKHFFEACRLLQEMIEIPLEGFLLTPVQKICKYHLQLAELLKFTPPDHPDHPQVQGALEAMKNIATLINERKRKMESIEKLAGWQMLVDDWEGPDILEDSSELIYSGELNKINHAGWSQERYFFLFDHQLIYCKKDLLKKSSFGYKGRINMDTCQVISLPDGRDAQYNVSVRNGWKLHDTKTDKWYLLVAKTIVAKQRWLKAFQDERRRVKDDTENNFNIPSHVKQSVIASLKQKSAHNKPKGKARFTRANSASQVIGQNSQIGIFATLPRKDRQKAKPDVAVGNKGKKLGLFFLGRGKNMKERHDGNG